MKPQGQLPDRLPEWMRSIRIRYTLLYSGVLFGLAALVVLVLYVLLSVKLSGEPVSQRAIRGNSAEIHYPGGGVQRLVGPVVIADYRAFERAVNQQTLDQLRMYSLEALAVLFLASLAVGWMIAGRVLAPIRRITDVAKDIQATDLSRRIQLQGPDDELKQLADTFDAMLARLDAAFAAQQQFVADASHELRNPLAIIRTNVDVALADPDPTSEEVRQTLTVVKRAGDRMARLVDDLLALARRRAPTFQSEPVDLGGVVAEASEEFLTPAEARGIALERTLAPGLTVLGDPDTLKRAVANLLENAIRLAPPGSTVRLALGSEQGRAWIAVADQGPGIAPADQPRVFDRFWRADKARARRDGGSGLGLAIVRQIAESHQGEVRLHSVPGAGSTFTIWLPLAPAGEPAPPRKATAPSR